MNTLKIDSYIIVLLLLLNLTISSFAQVNFSSSKIPIIVINTDSLEIADEYRIVANMGVINNRLGEVNYISDSFNAYYGQISIETRGSTSQSFPKKSYGFETQDCDNNSINVSLLGMPKENDWILYAPYSDKSLIRNILTYKLSSELGHYAPRTKLCELILNGEYRGVYVLIEKIKRDPKRVNISKLQAEEISGDELTGGYIIKIDKNTGSTGTTWETEIGGIGFKYEYPEYDQILPEQKEYIKTYIDSFELALTSDHYMDVDSGYRKYINVNSFVDFFIINELTKNIDGYFLSTFFFKDKASLGGKLTMGPVWDFNLAFGNANYNAGSITEGFQIIVNPSPWWWDRLLQDETFVENIKNRWCTIRGEQFRTEKITAIIDSLSLLLDESQQRNFTKWDIIGKHVWPNSYVGDSYEDEIGFLKTWTLNRLRWLDDSLSCPTNIIEHPKYYETSVFPNPFSNNFSYHFSLKEPGNISLILYDINGVQITKIVDEVTYITGTHTIDYCSSAIPSSIYIVVLKVNGETVSRKKLIKLI